MHVLKGTFKNVFKWSVPFMAPLRKKLLCSSWNGAITQRLWKASWRGRWRPQPEGPVLVWVRCIPLGCSEPPNWGVHSLICLQHLSRPSEDDVCSIGLYSLLNMHSLNRPLECLGLRAVTCVVLCHAVDCRIKDPRFNRSEPWLSHALWKELKISAGGLSIVEW